MAPPVFFLIAGEASGDLLGARLMRALRLKLNNEVRFVGIGGPAMEAEGLKSLFPHTELMHFGILGVIPHIPQLLKHISHTADEVVRLNPAALITIDSPDFCFRVAKLVKKRGLTPIPLIHYVAPTVWAWRPGRAKKIARFLDHLLATLPFEPPYFTRVGLDCVFVGHSVVEGGADKGDAVRFRSTHHLAAEIPLLSVLPGSRLNELKQLLPIFRKTVEILGAKHKGLQIVIPTLPHLKDILAKEVASWRLPVHIVEGEKNKYDAMAASTTALACSGTVALELALAKLPAVIAYKIKYLPRFIYSHFLLVPYANLVNIMHNKEVVPEFIQENCTPERLASATDILLSQKEAREAQISSLSATAAWLGQGQFVPSERAAETVLGFLRKKSERQPAVLQVLPALGTGGVERGTVETTAALTKAGFRAVVASSGGPMVKEIEAAGGTHITLPLASKNPLVIHKNSERLYHLIHDHKISLVHARSRAPAWSAYYAALKAKVPFVTTFHSAYGAGSPFKRLYNSVMAKGARVIAISSFVAEYAKNTYGVTSPQIIPRGVDTALFDPAKVDASRIARLRQEWGLPTDRQILFMPARLTRWKGQSVLLEALSLIKGRNYTCVIVGSGIKTSYGEELKQAIKDKNLQDTVVLFDTCRDMPAAYCLADIVLAPSIRPEGFGRVVIEAQAMGKLIIATKHGGAKETIIEGKTGWLVDPQNASALAMALEKALTLSASERQVFGSQAQAHIRAHFTTEMMTDKTLALYRELLKRG